MAKGKEKEKEALAGVWERGVREVMGAKGSRGKMEAMKAVLALRAKGKGSLKPWLAPMVEMLEDGDGAVREVAREVSGSISLYRWLKICGVNREK